MDSLRKQLLDNKVIVERCEEGEESEQFQQFVWYKHALKW